MSQKKKKNDISSLFIKLKFLTSLKAVQKFHQPLQLKPIEIIPRKTSKMQPLVLC